MKQDACKSTIHSVCRKARRTFVWVFALGCAVIVSQPPLSAASAESVAVKGPLARGPVSVAAVAQIRKVSRQVYRLMVDVDGAIKGGTAFLVSGQRVVATNNHVVDGGTAFWLGYMDTNGHAKRLPLHLIATYPQKDLALLEALDDLPGQALPLTTQFPPPASDLYAIGFPAAADPQGAPAWSNADDESYFLPSVLKGYVSRVLTNRWLTSQLQHQTPIVPGYSGGPLVNEEGTVAGISTSIHKEANGISYGVLAADLAEFATACSLPTGGDRVARRPAAERESKAPAADLDLDRMNTYALQDSAALNRAEIMLRNGAIYDTRLMCQHLVNATQSPEAYLCLGRTYDPAILSDLRVVGIPGNAGLAQFYYGQAARARRQPPEIPPEIAEALIRPLAMVEDRICDASLCKLVNRINGPAVSCERKRRN